MWWDRPGVSSRTKTSSRSRLSTSSSRCSASFLRRTRRRHTMADPFVGEIRTFGFNFPPTGWAQCNGQLLPISQNTALFALLGTYYGGDGRSTFALPNLQGASPMNQGQGPGSSDRVIGETGGAEYFTLIQSEMPAHTHLVSGS